MNSYAQFATDLIGGKAAGAVASGHAQAEFEWTARNLADPALPPGNAVGSICDSMCHEFTALNWIDILLNEMREERESA
jgi:hypothetical protein